MHKGSAVAIAVAVAAVADATIAACQLAASLSPGQPSWFSLCFMFYAALLCTVLFCSALVLCGLGTSNHFAFFAINAIAGLSVFV